MSLDRLLISIIVPVYNNPRDLRECLSALIGSSCSGSEIIVVDDGSTDDTFSVAAGMGVAVLRLARNSGPAAARNFGVRHARGDILFFVDADVVVMPGAVSRVVQDVQRTAGCRRRFRFLRRPAPDQGRDFPISELAAPLCASER